MQSTAIEICALSKSYGDVKAIDQLSFNIPQGSIFGLIGPNGAGKSTLLRTLMGILLPDSGDAFICNQSIKEKGPQIRQGVGYVPDVPHLYPYFKVDEMFSLGAKLYKNWDEPKCKKLSQQFQIPAGKRIRSLSRGMKVRTALVMALSMRPRVLILDEPTAGLDPVFRQAFLKAIISEAAEQNTTVLYSTHNLNDLERTSDHIAVLHQGRLLFSHSTEDLKNSVHRFQAVFTQDTLPEETLANLPGLINLTKQGSVYTFTIGGDTNRFMQALQALHPHAVKPVNLNLEDVFITYMEKEGYSFDYAI
ncbi:MAG: ABC transporter ATP-binding protein [Syntrophomonadaceae bacterium]